MEDLIIGAMFIVTVICYTVYKIDCNHVNKRKNNYPTDGCNNYRSLGKPKISKGERVPPGRPSEETMESLFGKDYKTETGRCSPKLEKAQVPPRKDSE